MKYAVGHQLSSSIWARARGWALHHASFSHMCSWLSPAVLRAADARGSEQGAELGRGAREGLQQSGQAGMSSRAGSLGSKALSLSQPVPFYSLSLSQALGGTDGGTTGGIWVSLLPRWSRGGKASSSSRSHPQGCGARCTSKGSGAGSRRLRLNCTVQIACKPGSWEHACTRRRAMGWNAQARHIACLGGEASWTLLHPILQLESTQPRIKACCKGTLLPPRTPHLPCCSGMQL